MPARLARCRRCGLGFRNPQPDQATLAALYAAGSETAWEIADLPRPDWRRAVSMIEQIGAATVLDVGCFDGSFLASLPPSVGRYGIEINREAVRRAENRGVNIVANDLHDLESLAEQFDCVAAFDVLEHVHDPARLLSFMLGAVKPGGHLVFATGNFAAPAHRLIGSRYLYSWYQEHIAFVSPAWTHLQARRLGFEVVALERFSHHPSGKRGFVMGALKNAVYRAAQPMIDRVRGRTPAGMTPGPPVWTSAEDHFIALLRRV